MKKKYLFIGIAVLAIVFAFFLIRGRNKKNPFTTEVVKKGDLEVVVSASGEIKAEKDTTLQFQTGGLLTWVGVKEGDKVWKGQAIASLDSRQIKKQLQKNLNLYMTQRDTFEQVQEDYKPIKEALLLTDAIRRTLDQTQNSLNNSVLDVELTDLSLQLATIHSPFNGVVVSMNTPFPGINILPTSASFRIIDPRSLYFQTQVDETDIPKIKEGREVTVKLDAFPEQVFTGQVDRIDLISTLSSGGGTAYKVQVGIKDLGDLILRVGMNGDAEILETDIKDALLLPATALVEKDGKTYVWKVEKSKAKKSEIAIGQANDNYIQIFSGLNENDLVITSNINLLKEGTAIKR